MIFSVDFEQPRALWENWSPDEKKTYVKNVSLHFRHVTNDEVKKRQCRFMYKLNRARLFLTIISAVRVWAAVDPELSNLIAKAICHDPVEPLEVAPASEAVKFRPNLGFAFKFLGIL